MTPRTRAVLRQPHMVGVAQLPGIEDVPVVALEALEPFVGFCARHGIGAPGAAELNAFAATAFPPKPTRLAEIPIWRGDCLRRMAALEDALARLGLSSDLIAAAKEVREQWAHRLHFSGYAQSGGNLRARSVSVSVDELPTSWQNTLRKLRRNQAYSLPIVKRMEDRLGMFAWSAARAGCAVDLADEDAECGLYDDLIQRSRERAIKSGEDPIDAEARWAYLRSTAEELKRFATHHGVDDTVMARLDRNYRGFADLESRQTPLKFFRALAAPHLPVTLASARLELDEASGIENPAHRHHRRLKACARGITVACPPRARDVVDRMVWGAGVYFRKESGTYAFDYEQSKTRSPLKVGFAKDFNRFFDAILLGDNDPRYLPLLRDEAIARRRPLFVRYDGEPVAYGWFGRTWDEAIGSSSHLARTLLQTFLADLGEVGFRYGRRALGHRSERMIERYRDETARQKSAVLAGAAFAARAEQFGNDDISDLL